MTDQLTEDLRRLAHAAVPVGLDHGRAARDGRRHLLRRRARRTSVAAVAVVGAAGVVGSTWTHGASVGRDVGPGVATATSSGPSGAATTAPTLPPTLPPLTGGDPVRLLSDALFAAVEDGPLGSLGGGAGVLADGHVDGQVTVEQDGRTGYLGAALLRGTGGDPCETDLHPRGGTGRTCVTRSDARGEWAVLGWRDSDQGPVTAVRVVGVEQAAVVAVSVAEPQYASTDAEQRPDELPRGNHQQDDQGTVLPVGPPLLQPPLSEDRAVALARQLLTIDLSD